MKDFKIYLSVASALMLIYFIAQYNKPAPINWDPTLYYNDKIPFGTYISYRQLGDIFPEAEVKRTNASIYKTFHDSTVMPGNYLIIAKSVNINKDDFKELVKYIKTGSSVFISAYDFNGFLADTLGISTSYEYKKGDSLLSFTSGQLKNVSYTFRSDIGNQYFTDFDTSRAVVISKNGNDHSTFLSFKYGAGNLYVCANPGIFSNYSLLNKNCADYAAKVLSYLPQAKHIYWDEFQNGDIPEDESPLRVFFKHPNLQWAYYLSLFGITLFILFQIKRRQRIIPVVEPLANATLDFVNVVGQVYYEKRNNANIAHKKILYLLTYLRDEYYIRTNKLDTEFIEKLTNKTGVARELVVQLVSSIQLFDSQQHVSDHELIELNKLIEKFYTKSR